MNASIKRIFLSSVLSLGLMSLVSFEALAQMPEHIGGPDINADKYSDNLLATFGAVPIVDWESASLYVDEASLYQLKDNNEFKDVQDDISDPKTLKGEFTFVDDAGNTVIANEGETNYHHPYSRLDELRQIALSYKPEPEALKMMRHDNVNKGEGTSLYPGNEDKVRSFTDYTNKTSENTVSYYKGSPVRPGIKQILFYNRDGYQTLEAMPIRTIELNMMDKLTEQREESANFDEREPLKIAAWFEHKLLMPLKDITVELKTETATITGNEEVARSILSDRRKSFLQESILDALRTSAYVQIRSGELLDVLGLPATDGVEPPRENLMNSLIGEGVKFVKTDKGYYTFDGPFISAVTPTNNSSVDTDLNSSLRINFIARDIFAQMLANYQQLLAARLQLQVASSTLLSSPKLSDDESGMGVIRKAYQAELDRREQLEELSE